MVESIISITEAATGMWTDTYAGITGILDVLIFYQSLNMNFQAEENVGSAEHGEKHE